jgi:hypothetical protein
MSKVDPGEASVHARDATSVTAIAPPELPEAIRAGTVAMIKAVSSTVKPRSALPRDRATSRIPWSSCDHPINENPDPEFLQNAPALPNSTRQEPWSPDRRPDGPPRKS